VQRRSYTYRPDGYITSIDDHLSGPRRFDLDPTGRVTAVHGTGWIEHYAYDPAGNITNATWPTPPQADTLDAQAQGERQYTGTLIRQAGNVRYQHDAQGRVTLRQQKRLSAKPRTWHYTWNSDDRLTAVTTPDGQRWQYQYDPLGRRIAKQRLGDHTTVVEQVDFTLDGVVLAEQTHTDWRPGTAEPAGSHTTVWNWEPDSFRPVSQTERTPLQAAPQEWVDEQFYAIVTDLVGTPAEMVDPGGDIVWHPHTTLWGALLTCFANSTHAPLRFPGQYHDLETGFNYNYYRHYDPIAARYESNDPLGLAGGLNTHAYVNNPEVAADPFGLTTCTVQLFRNVDEVEFNAIANSGRFGLGSGQMEGKWFALVGDHAEQWGNLLNGGRGLTVETRIPKWVADQLYHHAGKLDGIGPAMYANADQLALINKFFDGIRVWP